MKMFMYIKNHEWKVKTEDAKQASDTFSTKKAKQRAKEIANNRGTHVIEHQKMNNVIESE